VVWIPGIPSWSEERGYYFGVPPRIPNHQIYHEITGYFDVTRATLPNLVSSCVPAGFPSSCFSACLIFLTVNWWNSPTLLGGFEYFFIFTPKNWGSWTQFDDIIFFRWVEINHQPTGSNFYLSSNWRNICILTLKQQLFRTPRLTGMTVPPGGHFGCVLLRRHGGQYVRETPTETAGDGKVVSKWSKFCCLPEQRKNISTKFKSRLICMFESTLFILSESILEWFSFFILRCQKQIQGGPLPVANGLT